MDPDLVAEDGYVDGGWMGQSAWKSPSKQWPDHSRPEAQKALQRARRGGWWLKKSTAGAKVWGVITCGDPDLPRDQRCSTIVMSTSGSSDGSETAQALDGFMRKCPHAREVVSADVMEQAKALVAAAGKSLDAARALIRARGHRELMEDFLAQAMEASDKAQQLLDLAMEQEERAATAESSADRSKGEAGASADSGLVELARFAESRAASAAQLVADEKDRESRSLRGRCDVIRSEAKAIIADL